MKPRLSSFAARVALAVSSFALCHAAFAADPVKIGVPVGLSGANSVVAPSVVQAAQLAVDEINAKGGILGRPVALAVAEQRARRRHSIR
jgi:urea transport system substrate-binding protein